MSPYKSINTIFLWLFLAGTLHLLLPNPTHARELERMEYSTLDAEALTYARGPAARFATIINGKTHQQSPLTTFRGYQYGTYFDAERRVCLARRKLPSGEWDVIHFEDHRMEKNDSHNTAVVGICKKDGTIHMAFDHHADPLNYRVSKIGVALHPDSVEWNADLFSGVLHSLGDAATPTRLTYPRFFPAPNGNLMLYYRSVTSANGDGMIQEYDGDLHQWTPGLGKFIARDIGVYTDGKRKSKFRCPYINGISYSGDRLHVSWGWRDRFEKTLMQNNHDLCYAYSDDDGRTWHNSDGSVIGKTGESPIHLNSHGLVVADIPTNHGLTNQNGHYAYPDGRVHVILLHKSDTGKGTSYHHYWRTRSGEWKSQTLGFKGSRPKIIGDDTGTLYLIHSFNDKVRIAKGIPNRYGTSYIWSAVKPTSKQQLCEAEPLIDMERWELEQVMSIYAQERPEKIIRTNLPGAIDGMPSPLNVVDYYFK